MATTLNLGNIKGDQGDKGDTGDTGATPVITTLTGTNVPVDTQGTATADTTDPANPIITFGLPTGATGATPVITASATALANGETPTATADTTDPANPSIAFGIPAGDQGIQGETGPAGPAGSASLFQTQDVVQTIPMRWTTRGTLAGTPDTTNYATYIDANGSTNGLCRWYTGATVVNDALFTGGAPMSTRAGGGTITLSTFDNDGVAWTPITGGVYTWVDGANTWEVTLTSEVTGADLPTNAANFANLGLTAWRATTILTGTGSESETGTLWTLDVTTTVAVAGQVFAQGAFTLDNLVDPADLYIKRSTGSVTTAADEASLPANNTTDFQPITLP